jgi:AcrR family transcriptional regulator
MAEVKVSRQEKAAATRSRMVDAAYDSFCTLGYRATTMAAIAERAGVAVQTLYFTFHTKDALLQEVHNRTVLGDDGRQPNQQSWFADATAQPKVDRTVSLIVEGVSTILGRVAPLLPVFHAVAADPAGAVFLKGEDRRRRGMRELAGLVLAKPGARTAIEVAAAADLLYVLLGPEIYRSFVIELGWSTQAWVDWTTNALVRELGELGVS